MFMELSPNLIVLRFEFRLQGSGVRVQIPGFRVQGLKHLGWG